MKEVSFVNREVIFKEGDTASNMYQILSGKVAIVAKYGTDMEQQLAILGAGKFFGEMGVIENAPRSATVVAQSDVVLLEIDGSTFPKFVEQNADDILTMMTNLSASLRRTTNAYVDATKTVEKYVGEAKEKKTSVWQKLVKIAKHSKDTNGTQIAEAVTKPLENYDLKAGDIIFKKGQKANNMFKILEGEVGIYLNYKEENQIELSKLGKTEIFGEMAVIEEERRNATAVALTDTKLRSIANTEFVSYIEDYPEDALRILRNLSKKLRETTINYMEVLATIAECVKDEENEISDYGVWDRFVEYSKIYNEYSKYEYTSGFNHYTNMSGAFFF